jgi:hypothetical protein
LVCVDDSGRLLYLDVSGTGCSSKGFVGLLSALQENGEMSSSIEYLSLANHHGKFGVEGSTALQQYLTHVVHTSAVYPRLRELNLSNTGNPNLKLILPALVSGKIQLKRLDLSHNSKFTGEDSDALADYLSQASASGLEQLNLSNTFLSPEALEKILTRIHPDFDLSLDLSNNNLGVPGKCPTCEILSSFVFFVYAGAKMLGTIAYKVQNVRCLDLSDNDMGDEGIAELAQGLRNNHSITRLILNRNFKGKTKFRTAAIDNLIKLVSSECEIEGNLLQTLLMKDD